MYNQLPETDLLKIAEEIEHLRNTLNNLVNLTNNFLDPEVLKLSLVIDELVVKYMSLCQTNAP